MAKNTNLPITEKLKDIIYNRVERLLFKPSYPDNMIDTVNPHLKVMGKQALNDYILRIINDYRAKESIESIELLDIGGGKGWGKLLYEKEYIKYCCLDLKTSRVEDNIEYIQGDITANDLNLNRTFDIIFSKDTFEHILNPWDATPNILKLLKNNGLLIFLAPFSWRYHPSPYDTYRYTHTGAQYLFERLGKMKKVESGYIVFRSGRGFWKNKKDWTIDSRPFPRPLGVLYIGQKDDNVHFSTNALDSDFDWNHEI